MDSSLAVVYSLVLISSNFASPIPGPEKHDIPPGSFGMGASAGYGGKVSQVGMGSFNPNHTKEPYSAFGAFAGMDFGGDQKLGVGCSGLSCGFQLGRMVLATPQLIFFGPKSNNESNATSSNSRSRVKRTVGQTENLASSGYTMGKIFRGLVDGITSTAMVMYKGLVTTTDAVSSFFKSMSGPQLSSRDQRSSQSQIAPSASHCPQPILGGKQLTPADVLALVTAARTKQLSNDILAKMDSYPSSSEIVSRVFQDTPETTTLLPDILESTENNTSSKPNHGSNNSEEQTQPENIT